MRAWHKRIVIGQVKAAIPGKRYLRPVWRRFSPCQTDAGEDAGVFENAVRQIEFLHGAGRPAISAHFLTVKSALSWRVEASPIVILPGHVVPPLDQVSDSRA